MNKNHRILEPLTAAALVTLVTGHQPDIPKITPPSIQPNMPATLLNTDVAQAGLQPIALNALGAANVAQWWTNRYPGWWADLSPQFANTRRFWWTNVPARWWTNVPTYWWTNTPLHWWTNVPAANWQTVPGDWWTNQPLGWTNRLPFELYRNRRRLR